MKSMHGQSVQGAQLQNLRVHAFAQFASSQELHKFLKNFVSPEPQKMSLGATTHSGEH